MIINKLFYYRRTIIIGIMPFLICLLIDIPCLAQEKSPDEPRSANMRWTIKDEVIIINYDLVGALDTKYNVQVEMKRKNNPSFAAIPVTVEGDVGEGYFAGTNREIQWYYRKDFPEGFKGEGYYFEIQVKPIGHQNMTLYYVAGGVAVVGGLVALLASKSKSTTTQPSELPIPPGRP